MANKPLKSIKFPGLNDTYTVPEVDATLATTGAAADAKKVGDEISDIKADLSTIVSGNYPINIWEKGSLTVTGEDDSYRAVCRARLKSFQALEM